jgi:hypothetical protein
MGDKPNCGFLVVLSEPEYRSERNPRYFGVDARPECENDIPEEKWPLEQYDYGKFKDPVSNLVPTYEKAQQLLDAFSRSPRKFEIIFCGHGPDDLKLNAFASLKMQGLGYDIAGISGDGWSIVSDMTASDWARPFVASLNESGLFPNRVQAEEFLRQYCAHKEADYDCPFDVVFVARVEE